MSAKGGCGCASKGRSKFSRSKILQGTSCSDWPGRQTLTLFSTLYLLVPTSYPLPPTSYLLPPTSYLLPPTSLPTTSYLLPPTSYLLPPASCLLLPTSYLLPPTYHLYRSVPGEFFVARAHPGSKQEQGESLLLLLLLLLLGQSPCLVVREYVSSLDQSDQKS